jgi:hypothetical protein
MDAPVQYTATRKMLMGGQRRMLQVLLYEGKSGHRYKDDNMIVDTSFFIIYFYLLTNTPHHYSNFKQWH